MNTLTKRIIAKEWLVFLGCSFLGTIALPLIVITFIDKNATFKDVLDAFFVNPKMSAWVMAALPYILYQLIRSLIWAIKTSRAKSTGDNNENSGRWHTVPYEEAKQHKLYGVGGWLYVLLLQMGLGVLAVISNWVGFKQQYAEMLPAQQALNDAVLAFNNVQVVLNVILGLMIALTMIYKWSRFRLLTSAVLAIGVPLALLIAAVMDVPTIGQLAEQSIPPYAVMCLIWLPYLHFSKRVRVTFDHSMKQH